MEWCTPVAQTQPKPQRVIALVSRIQKSSTRDNNFVRWSSRDILVWPTKMTRPVKVDYLESWSRIFRSDQTEMDHFDQTNRNFQNFGLNGNKAPLDSSLWRILRFTSRLHTAYLPNYFQLFLLKFCHTVDQFYKWTSPKTVENKNPCGVQTWLTV